MSGGWGLVVGIFRRVDKYLSLSLLVLVCRDIWV